MSARPRLPTRPMFWIALLVLAGHALVLRGTPATVAWRSTQALVPREEAPVMSRVRVVAAPAVPQEAIAVPPRRTGALPKKVIDTPPPVVPEPPPVVTVPDAAAWHYTVDALHRGLPAKGTADLAWSHDGRRYEATLRIDLAPLAPRVQRSTGMLRSHGLAPERFSERVRGEEAAHFDAEAGRIVFSANAAAAPLRPGAQDRLSVLLQLGALLAARPQGWSTGDALVVQTATTREAADWRFVVEGRETIALPTGPADALRLARAPRHAWEPRLELWYAPGAADGPVRLRLTPANGDWLDMQWSGTDKR